MLSLRQSSTYEALKTNTKLKIFAIYIIYGCVFF